MRHIAQFELNAIAAGVSREHDHPKQSQSQMGPKEDFLSGVFFTIGSMIVTGIAHIIENWSSSSKYKDTDQDEKEARYGRSFKASF